MTQRIKDGVIKTEAEIRAMYPKTSFAASTYDELGWSVYTPVAPAPTPEQIRKMLEFAVEVRVEDVARSLGFNSGLHAATYTDDPDPAIAARAQAFKAWRSAVWAYCRVQDAAVAGGAPIPTKDELLDGLPTAPTP